MPGQQPIAGAPQAAAAVPAYPVAAGPQPAPAGATPVEPLPVADLPAGLDPDELNAVPATSARRGKLRRRIAFLRAAREVLLRDLGGFVYELHRTAHDIEHDAHRRLRETKLTRLSRVDAELHELEYRLDDVRRQVVVREPGVGGECPDCGELFGTAAHYCWNCGLPLTESARRARARAEQAEAAPDPVIAPAPAPEPVVPVTDQSTQELPRLDPDHPEAGPEFRWPSRAGSSTASDAPTQHLGEPETAMHEAGARTTDDASIATGESAPASEAAASETDASADAAAPSETDARAGSAGDAPEAVAGGAAASEDDTRTGDASDAPEATAGEAAASEDDARTGDDAPEATAGEAAASEDDAPTGDDAPEATAGEAAASEDDAPTGDDAPEATAGEAAASEGDARAEGAGDAAARDAESGSDSPTGDAPRSDEPAGSSGEATDESPNGSVFSPVERRP